MFTVLSVLLSLQLCLFYPSQETPLQMKSDLSFPHVHHKNEDIPPTKKTGHKAAGAIVAAQFFVTTSSPQTCWVSEELLQPGGHAASPHRHDSFLFCSQCTPSLST